MNFQYGLIIAMGLLVSASLVLIYNQPDQIPKWQALHDIKQQDTGFECDEQCKQGYENNGAICIEGGISDYVCRPPREIRFPEREYPILGLNPPEYGELAYFPDGLNLTRSRIFDVAQVDMINPETKQVRVEFGSHHLNWPETFFEYSATMYPGDTFVSHCTGINLKIGHLVEYIDTFELDGTTYIEFWGSHVIMPDNLLPCEMPDLIEHSLPMDLSLGIEFDIPKPKPSQWDFRTLPSYVFIPKGSALPDNEHHLIPKDITVYLGKNNTVTWINEDDTPSTLVADDGTWSTGQLLFGDTASITFNETGVYHYHGMPHPWKTGSITVKD